MQNRLQVFSVATRNFRKDFGKSPTIEVKIEVKLNLTPKDLFLFHFRSPINSVVASDVARKLFRQNKSALERRKDSFFF